MIIENISLSRRQFLGGAFSAGAFVIASRFVPETLYAQEAIFNTKADTAMLHPSVYLGIEPNGTVFIVTHRSEMGTGIRTSLPLVAADELDADWSRCRIEQGVGDPRYGDQNTDGSRSIRDFYEAFRVAGASAKSMLVTAAAAQLRRARLGTDDGQPSGRACEERKEGRLRRAGVGGGKAARAEERGVDVQAEERVEVRRQGTADLRPDPDHDGCGAVRPRHPSRGHGLRVDRASAGVRRHGQEASTTRTR